MDELIYTLLKMSISASILVLVVLLLRLFFKKAPKWVNVLLWALVAIRLVFPFSVESSLSLMPDIDRFALKETSSYVDTDVDIIPDTITQDIIADDVTVQYHPNEPVIEIHRGVSAEFVMTVIWLCGIAGMAGYMIVSYICVWRRVRNSTLFRDNIYMSEAVSSPFVFGIVKPRIYLPENIDAVNMSYVIAHEEAHLHRRDHLWKPLGFILLAVHWFNPVIWLAYILLCRDIEMACDERVVSDMNDSERADYSEALLDCSVDRRMITACPLAFGENNVKERIRTVLNYKKPAFWIVILAVVVCIVTAACFLTNPKEPDEVKTIHNTLLYDTASKEEMYIHEYEERYGVTVINSAHIDLDGDRTYEDVLWLKAGSNEYYGFLIVHYTDERAYAYELPYRAFTELKYDGTFSFSSGVADHGIGRISFDGDTYTINKIAYSESDSLTPIISYYIEGESVSKEDFEEYLKEWGKKPNANLNGWGIEYAIPDTVIEDETQNDVPYYSSELYKATEEFLAEEFHKAYDPYYEILSLEISDWNETDNEAVFNYTMTHQYYNRDPSTVGYIQAAKDDPERYEMMCKDYLAPKEGNYIFKVVLNGDKLELYSNESPTEVIWNPVKVTDYLPKAKLTLDKVIELSAKGRNLTWEDFAEFKFIETGSGLYIRVYRMDGEFELWIGGGDTDSEPMYIYLTLTGDLDTRIDIRDGGVEEFINEHKAFADGR